MVRPAARRGAAAWRPALVLVLAALAGAQEPAADRGLRARLMPLIRMHRGQVAVAMKHLKTGERFAWHEDRPMPAASVINVAVMVEAYRQAHEGKLDLEQSVTLRAADRVPGSGLLGKYFFDGTRLTLRNAIRLMIAVSDSTAANLVLDRIGLRSVSGTMARLGFPNTKLDARGFRRETSILPGRSKKIGPGSTTAAEMVRLFERLHRRELVSPAASEAMLGHLHACEDVSRFTRFLPPGTKVAHRPGSAARVRGDAGLIESPSGVIALCVLTSENRDRRRVADNTGNRLCARVARIVYDHFNPSARPAPPAEVLRPGSSGRLVEALQRTLNARVKPSPDLSVDGDFGSSTEAAVLRFQRSRSLAATGVVGPATWKALGPLVTRAAPVPAPSVVNRQKLPTAPPDPLAGPPFVTCKAWAVADATSGKLLWGKNEAKRLDIASTTKMMTAYLVVKLVEKEASVLDEEVVFSRRADRTRGSTAGIRTGEKLTVRELLYGLLLPSGNDAAVALAEHFGGRFAPPAGGGGGEAALACFVAEMNRTARRLGMQDTTYRNPHGLTARGHLSSARDLVRLAHAALKNELFRRYVRTRQHGCRLVGPGGYRRDVVWKNTNRLLAIEGYAGVKTGTTRAAGACLVSFGTRGDDRLLVVVLGSTSSDARYTDSRNLYRWAWRQRGHQP